MKLRRKFPEKEFKEILDKANVPESERHLYREFAEEVLKIKMRWAREIEASMGVTEEEARAIVNKKCKEMFKKPQYIA
jgi:hypothetical protein